MKVLPPECNSQELNLEFPISSPLSQFIINKTMPIVSRSPASPPLLFWIFFLSLSPFLYAWASAVVCTYSYMFAIMYIVPISIIFFRPVKMNLISVVTGRIINLHFSSYVSFWQLQLQQKLRKEKKCELSYI